MTKSFLLANSRVLLYLLIFVLTLNSTTIFAKNSSYTHQNIQGWNVYLHQELVKSNEIVLDDVLLLLELNLYQIKTRFPKNTIKHLQNVKIWIDKNHPDFPGAVYHPSAQWLKDNGFDENKAKSIHIANAENFLNWSYDQPAMLIHEMAHAYHHQVLGYDNSVIRESYQSALKNNLYENVLYIHGDEKKAYAINNEQEYFAELTEAWFSCNDYFPFVRPEIKKHDPVGYKMLQEIWDEQ